MAAEDHVSPRQQGYVFTSSYSKGARTRGSTWWSAHKGDQRVGMAAIHHEEARPEEFHTMVRSDYDERYHKHGAAGAEWEGEKVPQAPLFTSIRGRQAQDSVFSLFTTKQDRITAPIMLGMAQNEAMANTGQGLGTPRDLSEHSARMVQRLQKVGAVDPGAANVAANTHTWMDPQFDPPTEPWEGGRKREIVGPGEVRAGRQTVRGVLRAGRQTKRGEQLRLFQ